MKDIKIHIHDFGPLHEVEFQLAPMMIFTGMSSLGKSYANYVAYYTISSIAGDILERDTRDWYLFHMPVFFCRFSVTEVTPRTG